MKSNLTRLAMLLPAAAGLVGVAAITAALAGPGGSSEPVAESHVVEHLAVGADFAAAGGDLAVGLSGDYRAPGETGGIGGLVGARDGGAAAGPCTCTPVPTPKPVYESEDPGQIDEVKPLP